MPRSLGKRRELPNHLRPALEPHRSLAMSPAFSPKPLCGGPEAKRLQYIVRVPL
jgi:hypothetical protein